MLDPTQRITLSLSEMQTLCTLIWELQNGTQEAYKEHMFREYGIEFLTVIESIRRRIDNAAYKLHKGNANAAYVRKGIPAANAFDELRAEANMYSPATVGGNNKFIPQVAGQRPGESADQATARKLKEAEDFDEQALHEKILAMQAAQESQAQEQQQNKDAELNKLFGPKLGDM